MGYVNLIVKVKEMDCCLCSSYGLIVQTKTLETKPVLHLSFHIKLTLAISLVYALNFCEFLSVCFCVLLI